MGLLATAAFAQPRQWRCQPAKLGRRARSTFLINAASISRPSPRPHRLPASALSSAHVSFPLLRDTHIGRSSGWDSRIRRLFSATAMAQADVINASSSSTVVAPAPPATATVPAAAATAAAAAPAVAAAPPPAADAAAAVPAPPVSSEFTGLTPLERAHLLLKQDLGLSVADLPPPSLHVDVAIAGGGLGGLALAAGLQQIKLQQEQQQQQVHNSSTSSSSSSSSDVPGCSTAMDVHVFEAAPALRTDSGTIFAAAAHSFAALDGLQQGLADALKATGPKVAMSKFFRKELGSDPCTPATEIRRPGTGITIVPWKAAQRVLAERVRPDSVHCSHRLATYLPAPEGKGVDVVFIKRNHDAETPKSSGAKGKGVDVGTELEEGGEEVGQEGKKEKEEEVVVVRAQMLVGADGMRSAVRRTMVGDNPRYLRCINWNALVPNLEPWPTGLAAEPNTIGVCNDMQACLTWHHIDAGNGQTFWQLRIFDTDLTATATLDPEFGGFGRPGAKERALSLLNQRLDEAGRRNPSAAGAANAKPTNADCSKGTAPETSDSAGGVPERWNVLQRVIQSTDEKLIFERLILDRLPLESWSDLGGRVVLLGDAAHAMFPGPGQGAQMAFEDAHQLCESVRTHLSAAVGGVEDIGASAAVHKDAAADGGVLPTTVVAAVTSLYEKMRVQRCARVQSFAAELSALPAEEAKTDAVKALTQEETVKRWQECMTWLDKYPACAAGDPDSTYWRP